MGQSITIGSSDIAMPNNKMPEMLAALKAAPGIHVNEDDDDLIEVLGQLGFGTMDLDDDLFSLFWDQGDYANELMEVVFGALMPWIPDESFMSFIDNDNNTVTYLFKGGRHMVLGQMELVEFFFKGGGFERAAEVADAHERQAQAFRDNQAP